MAVLIDVPLSHQTLDLDLTRFIRNELDLVVFYDKPLLLRRGLGGEYQGRLVFLEHHESRAASAFFPSPFEEAAILTMDGVGEWATGSIGVGRGNQIELRKELQFPHSLGLLSPESSSIRYPDATHRG